MWEIELIFYSFISLVDLVNLVVDCKVVILDFYFVDWILWLKKNFDINENVIFMVNFRLYVVLVEI